MKIGNIKTNSSSLISFIVLAILVATQIVFLLLPNRLVVPFNRVCRPMLYASAIIITMVFIGKNERPVPKAFQATMLAAIGVTLYFIVLLVTGILFGFGKNIMTPNLPVLLNNVWMYSTAAFMMEFMRDKIIKGAPTTRRNAIAVVLTIIYSFAQLDALRNIAGSDFTGFAELLFVTVFPVLALNTVLSCIALEGSFWALLMVRCAYSLAPILLPVLPNVPRSVSAVITCSVLFITFVIYYTNMSGLNMRSRRVAYRRVKYQKKSACAYIFSIAFFILLAAFILRAFVYYPAVVYTGSMAGSLDRGTVAIIHKIRPQDVISTVREGDIVCYKYRNLEITHRIIEFSYNEEGERIYITKGDANTVADARPVKVEQVVGVIRARIPYLGYPLIAIQSIFRV